MKKANKDLLDSIAQRAHYLATRMIYMANHRDDVQKGDPKIGGHPSASASSLHILGALHMVVKSGFDHVANKPHASPTDHSYNYLLDLFLNSDLSKMSLEEANQAMKGLRAFSQEGEPVFQSYHSAYDPDHHNFFPSGTVGIPPVQAGYLAHAYELARKQGFEVPQAHFWALMGDSEFREGSLLEAAPDLAEREVGSLTWIVDYNRQSLDGHRITNPEIMHGNDDLRIQRTMEANGWEVIQVRHGHFRQELFRRPGGKDFQQLLEAEISDYELQVILQLSSAKEVRKELSKYHKKAKAFTDKLSDEELLKGLADMGGHDFLALIEALEASKKNPRVPTMIIAHTIKGWGLQMASQPGNHSALPELEEVQALAKAQGISEEEVFARFSSDSKEGAFLLKRGQELYKQIQEQHAIKRRNQEKVQESLREAGDIPSSLDINLKLVSYPHTQWMLGQLTAKLTRIANTPSDSAKPLSEFEQAWKTPSEMMISMAPDVGTSTNLNPSMDGKIFAAAHVEDMEAEFGVKDPKTPDLVPGEDRSDRFLRFEIAEANTMSCMGSYGRMRDVLGIPLLPLMTVYDFFVKRAHDQFFYNLYWRSSFILVGTPSGVTLSPEGAQHGWKSDFQIPNQITWEPFFCVELDWIFCDAFRRHMLNDNFDRSGVFIRGVTRGVDQKMLLSLLKTQARFKIGTEDQKPLCHRDFPLEGGVSEAEVPPMGDAEILESLRQDVLAGAYYLIDYRGYAGYEPGDNVVHIFSMGSPTTEAIKASQELLAKGIYANVIVVTSPDLLLGNLGAQDGFKHLRETLKVSGDLYLHPQPEISTSGELVTLAGRRIPIVSVHDGEVGLLDNIGSIVGVKQEALGLRKHSRCGRPVDVYRYHGIDSESVMKACERALETTSLERVHVRDLFSPRGL